LSWSRFRSGFNEHGACLAIHAYGTSVRPVNGFRLLAARADAVLREYSETRPGHQLPSGAQIRQVGENLRVALEAAGLGLKDLVKTTTYVTDMDVTDMDEFFKYHSKRPTRWRT
jgi:hypothetical protein